MSNNVDRCKGFGRGGILNLETGKINRNKRQREREETTIYTERQRDKD